MMDAKEAREIISKFEGKDSSRVVSTSEIESYSAARGFVAGREEAIKEAVEIAERISLKFGHGDTSNITKMIKETLENILKVEKK